MINSKFLFILVVAPITRLEHHYRDPLERPPSYNDLPQPEGDWTDAYQKKQFKYNSILGASVAFLVGTIIFVSFCTFF